MNKQEEPMTLLQSGVIPYRIVKDKPYLYLITSVSKGRWIVPKGVLEDELSQTESAIMEAYEEAGLIGIVSGKIFDTYSSEKWGRVTKINLYPMKVLEAVSDWPEKEIRRRIMIPMTKREIKARVSNPSLMKVLLSFAESMKNSRKIAI
ncbi:MAG: hypothetical protein JEY99_09190 [Spirochaetales bacterium]|nr:hypothetical protein [Spirochaetales bacterium]